MQSVRKYITLIVVLLVQSFWCLGQMAPASPTRPQIQAQKAYLDLPLGFERQVKGADERFVAQGNGYMIGLDKGRAVIGLPASAKSAKDAPGRLLSLDFVGGQAVQANPQEELQGKVNRYSGNDSRKWQTGLSTFGKVAYRDVYPGIDVVYYGNQKQLEFDFVVKPGADPNAILMKIGGTRQLAIDGTGALVIDQESPGLKVQLPAVYQEIGGARKKVAGRYRLRGENEVAFAVDSFDRSKPLVIDPTLIYSALVGGGTSSSIGDGIAVDSGGNIYITGYTFASDFPAVNAAQPGGVVAPDGFVTKINPAGTALIYSTYLGGSSTDQMERIAVDSTGAAWVAGFTQSLDFPLLNATQASYGGNGDAMVAKLSSTGVLQFSTYLGGSNYDIGYGIATDSSNNAYTTGLTQSANFPTTAGVLNTTAPSAQCAFVTKFSSSGTRVYSTYLGGASSDTAYALAADANGSAYVTGTAYSSTFTGAPGGGAQTVNAGNGDAFVAKLNATGSALSYFTFLGGINPDTGNAIALDSNNNAYIGGSSSSPGLATSGAAQTIMAGGTDALIAKLNATGSAFTYITYLGGNRQDFVQGIGIDSSLNAYVAGYTDSNNFPSISALQPNYPGNPTSLFQTTNTGTNWSVFDNGISGAVLDISADPLTSGILVAVTENGIYRTTNGGTSWTQQLPGQGFTALARSASASTIYALQPNNVYLSSDNGVTWTYQGSTGSGYYNGLVADPVSASTIFLYSANGGVLVSTNSGASFAAANTGLPTTTIYSMVVAADRTLYAAAYGSGIYKSTNQGTSWTAVNNGLPNPGHFYLHSLAVTGTTVYAAESGVYVTTNGGASWTSTAGLVPNGAGIIGVSPTNASLLYAYSYTNGSAGGAAYVSSNGGGTWTSANGGIASLAQITAFAFDPLNVSRAFLIVPVSQEGFVTQLNSAGSSFGYSTYFGTAGESGSTIVYGMATNSSGDVFLTGSTNIFTGGAYPATTTAFQGNPDYGAFVARISASTSACTVAIAPGSQTITSNSQVLGLSTIAPSGCAWSASSNQSWATIARGASDTGVDAITVQVSTNTSGATRTATITAGSATSTITQPDSSCTYSLSNFEFNLPSTGGQISENVTAPAGCPWTVTSEYPAVTITSGASGTGNGTVNMTVSPNLSLTTAFLVVNVADTDFFIAQQGDCALTLNPTNASLGISGGSGSITVTASSSSCGWQAFSNAPWITLTGAQSGTGNGTVPWSVGPNSGGGQSGSITIGNSTFPITEAGSGISITTPAALGTYSIGQFQIALNASGGTGGPYTWSLVSGSLPAGVFITTIPASSQPALVGIATVPGNYSFNLQATDGTTTGQQVFTLKITRLTLKDSFTLPDAFASTAYSYGFTALNNAGAVTFAVSSGTLPAGLTLSSAGVLSGTVTANPGVYNINISAFDGTDTAFHSYQLTVFKVNLTSPGALPNAPVGSSYSYQLAASGGTAPYTYVQTGGTLPFPLTLSTGGLISGTTGNNSGIFGFSVTVTDASNFTYQKEMSIDVLNSPITLSRINLGTIDDAVVGNQYGWQIPICCGGTGPFTWTATNLPAGMSIRTGSGVTSDYVAPGYAELWGVPTTAGNYNVTVTATDSVGAVTTLAFPFHVSPLSVSPASLSGGTLNTSYTNQLQILGGTGCCFVVNVPALYPLPDGLNVNQPSASGIFTVTGTPVENGSFDTIFQITDGVNTLTRNNFFNINNVNGGITITNGGNLGTTTVGANFSVQLAACCVSSINWSISGNPPSGLAISASGRMSGVLSVAGTYTFLVKAADGQGVAAAGYRQFTLIVTPLQVTTTSLNFANVGTAYNTTLAATGGTGSLNWAVTAFYLPPGLSLTGNGLLSGTPTSPGNYFFTVTVTDAGNNTAVQSLGINIYPSGQFPPVSISTGSNFGTMHLGTEQIGLSANNGSGTYTWSLISGTLPPGMALRTDVPSFFGSNQQAGLIGVATTPGNYSFTLNVASGGTSQTQAFTIRFSGLDLQDAAPADAYFNVPYTYTFTPIANAGPVSFAVNTNSTNGSMPPGLTLSSAGVLSGTPTTPGTYIIAMNISDGTDTQYEQFTLYIYKVQITSPAILPNGTQGSSYSTTITSGGGTAPYTYTSSGNLPAGLTLSTAGVVSGTITGGPGLYGFAVQSVDSTGVFSYTENMSLDVVSTPVSLMEITNRLFADPVIGDHYGNVQSVCCGGTGPFTWTVTGLPPGLTTEPNSNSFNQYPATPGNVQIYGVPQSAGTYNVQYTVTDALGASTSLTVPMHVSNLDVATTGGTTYSLPNGTIHTAYSSKFRVLGGTGPYAYVRNVNGELPDGLSAGTPANLTVSGTPLENGNYSPWFLFADGGSNTLTRSENILITGGTSTITISNNGTYGYNLGSHPVGASYSTTFTATGAASYTWSLDASSAALPAGLSLSSGGGLSGTPTAAGTYTFLIDAAQTGTPSNVGVKSFVITISQITITTTSLPFGVVGSSYSATLASTGGSGAMSWVQTYGFNSQLPPGLTLNSNGTITGTPTSAGLYSVDVQENDGAGNVAIATYALDVYVTGPPLNLPNPAFGPYTIGGNQLQIQLAATGGTPPYHYSLTPNATVITGMRVQDGQPLPTAFPSSVTGGFLGVLGPGSYSTSIRVTDNTGATFDRAISFSVLPVDITTSGGFPPAILNTAYSFQMTAYGGSGSYVWSSTTLPAGLSINPSTGLISGTPTVTGTFTPGITLGDAAGGGTISRSANSITIYPYAITDNSLQPVATALQPYSFQLHAPGCGTGCTWSVVPGDTITSGFTLSSSGLFSGTYTGAAGFIDATTFQVTGSNGTSQKVFTIEILPAAVAGLQITTNITNSSVLGNATQFTLAASGGTVPYSFSVVSGTLPTGISLQSPSSTTSLTFAGFWELFGRTEVVGTYNFTLQVTDANGVMATKALTWQVSPMEILYTSLPISTPVANPLVLNQPYNQPILIIGGTGNYTSWITAGPVYPGLSANSSNGVVSGTPTNTGSQTTAWTVTDSGSNTVIQNVSINATSNSSGVDISLGGFANNAVFALGATSLSSLSPSGGTGPYTITAVGALPAGVAILQGNAETSSISSLGAYVIQITPETPGNYTYTLKATDANGVTGQKTYNYTVTGFSYPFTTSLNDGSVGVAYSQAIYSLDPTTTLTFAVATGATLPPGLTLSTGGVLSGTPTNAGTYSFNVTLSDSTGSYTTAFQLRISSIAVTSPGILPNATVGVAYSYQMTSTGGSGTVTWSASGLPSGLSMSPAGLISGTPVTAANVGVTITATDGVVAIAGQYTLPVRTPNAGQLSVSTAPLADGVVGRQYAFEFSPSGGVAPYAFTLALGSAQPPPGLSLVPSGAIPGNAPGTYYLFGVPTTAGNYTFSLQIADAASNTITIPFTLHISTISTVTGNPPNAVINVPYSFQFTAVDGTAPYTYSISQEAIGQETLPAGLSVSSTGLISGTPLSTGNYVFSLKITDSLGVTFTTQASLRCTNAAGLFVSSIDFPYLGVGIGASQLFSTGGGTSTYTWSVVNGALPTGTFLRTSGTTTNLGGAATVPGTYTWTLRATDNNNSSNFADHIFTQAVGAAQIVNPANQTFNSLYLPPAVLGQSYSQTLFAAGGGAVPYTFAESPFNSDVLPVGLTLSAAGVLSGTPLEPGVFSVRPLVTDVNGFTRTSFAYQLLVTPSGVAPLVQRSISAASNASVGAPFVFALDRAIFGGTPPYTWTGSGLPPGLAIVPGGNGVSAYLTGTATTAGAYTPTLTVTDSASQNLSAIYNVTVSPLALTPGAVPAGIAGTAYAATLTPSGGTAPYNVSLATISDLPPGLTLSSAGVLSGTPTYAGNFLVSVVLTDSASNTLNKLYEITIDDSAGEAPVLSIVPAAPINITYTPGAAAPSVSLAITSTGNQLTFSDIVTGIPGASLTAATGSTPANPTLNFSTGGLTAGYYSGVVVAKSAGSANYAAVVPVNLTVTAPGACTTSLTSNLNPSVFPQPVTLTGSISCVGGTGTISFLDGPTTLNTLALVSGSVQYTTAALTTGTHSLTAVYSGDSTFMGSTSTAVTQAVNRSSTTTSLTASPNPSQYGQNITLTATVSPSSATGSVNFFDGTTNLGSIGLSSGMASFGDFSLFAGTHTFTAVYNGDTNDSTSTSSAVTQTITPLPTTAAVTPAANPGTFGQVIGFTVAVSPSAAPGVVMLYDGNTQIGATAALTNGTGVINVGSLGVGSHSITAKYPGGTNYAASTSPVVTEQINGASTTTTLTSSVNPSAFGAPVTLTATVTPSAATGTVTFLDGSFSLGTGGLINGVATFTTSILATGTHSITANYGGDTNDSSSVSSAITQTVNVGAATVSLSSAPNPSTVGQTVTLTATVTPSTATGTITFNDGTNPIITIPLNSGSATTTTSALTAGPHNLTASYSGDSNFGAAVSQTGPALSFTSSIPNSILDFNGVGTGFTTRLPGTGTSIAANDPNLQVETTSGTLTWLTTGVNLNGQSGIATGDFLGFPLSVVGVTANQDFSFSVTFNNLQFTSAFDQIGLFVGTSSSSAFRGGELNTGQSTAYTVQTVNGADTNLQSSNALGPLPGDNVIFTLSRTSGTWAFAVQNLTNPSRSGNIPVTQPTFLNGIPNLIGGVYASNASNATFKTETISSFSFAGGVQNVQLPATTTTVTSSLNPTVPGQQVTFTATVTSGSGTPTGTVIFKDGNTVLSTNGLAVGSATFTTSSLAGGIHSITVVYSGDANNAPSTSSVLTQTVTAPATTTTMMSSLNPSSFAQNVVFTATVSPSTATGSVTFSDGSTQLGVVTLTNGTASFPTAGLTAGSHSIVASYGGDVSDAISSSSPLTQVVNPLATTTSLSSSANPASQGQSITLRASVTPSSATGTVTFKDGSGALGTATLSQGIASISVTLGPGSHSLTAVYGGDQNNRTSTSPVVSETVNFPTLTISTSSLPSGKVNQSYGPVSFTVSGGSGSYTWSASALPAGLGFSSTGVLSGTPTAGFSGSVTFTVTDTISNSTSQVSLTLTIATTPLTLNGPSTLGNFVPGATISASFTAAGGTPPYSWTVSGASGLAVNSSGTVTGSAGAPGNYSATVTVTDSQSASVNRTLPLTVFGITTSSLPPGTTTTTYSASLSAIGGTPPYSFSATGLPPGVTLSGATFGGTPTTAGSYSVSVHGSDSGGLSATAGYSISITAGTAPLSVFTSSLADATVGQPYSGGLSATGGATPYSWSQSGGVLPGGFTLNSSGSITGSAITPGPYSIGVKVTDTQGNIAVGSVSLNVDPAPVIITNGSTFPSGFVGVDYPAQVLMASGGTPPYAFTVAGSLPAGLSLSNSQIGGTPSAAATNSFTVKVTDSSTVPLSGSLGVTVNIQPPSPGLLLATSSVSFAITSGTTAAPSPSSVGVTSSVIAQNLSFTATASVPWVTVTGGSTTPGVVSIALNSAALALTASTTPYSGSVVVTCTSSGCSGGPQNITVSLVVSAPPPLVSLGAGLLSFASLTSSPVAQTGTLPITNAGGGSLAINSVTSDSPWLTVSTPPATVLPGPGTTVTVTVSPAGLAAGYYRGVITVTTSGGNATAVVTLSISGAATITLGPSGSQFSLPQGGALGNGSGSFNVNASGGASVPFTAAVVGASWLSVTAPSGTAANGAPASVGFAIDPVAAGNFAAGTYYGTVRITASGVVDSPQDYQVVLAVTPASTPVVPDPEPAGQVFVTTAGGTAPSQTITVYASSRTAIPFQAAASEDTGSWLSIAPSTGAASAATPGQVAVSVNTTGLTAGAYRGLVSFSFGSSVRAVNITLIVQPQAGHQISSVANPQAASPLATGPTCANATLVPTQTGLVDNFSVPTAWPTPLSIQLFDTCGSTVGNAQIVATFTNGDPPLPLSGVNTGTGVYSGTWTPRKAASQVTITASVSAQGYPGASVKIAGQTPPNSAPVLAPNGAGDVFNPLVGAGLGPGNIIQIYGTGLASQQNTPAVLPLPTTVVGTSVVIGGVQAPLFYVSPTQVNAQIPFGLTAGNQYQLLVSANGALTTPLSIQLNAGAPALLNFSSGAIVAQHLDGTLVLPTAPAVPGEFIVIYSSGLGATDQNVASGAPSPSNPPANVTVQPVVTLNGNPVNLLFAGLTPGLVGLYQVNFQVPLTLTTGNYNLVLTQGTTISNTTVLAVAAPNSQAGFVGRVP